MAVTHLGNKACVRHFLARLLLLASAATLLIYAINYKNMHSVLTGQIRDNLATNENYREYITGGVLTVCNGYTTCGNVSNHSASVQVKATETLTCRFPSIDPFEPSVMAVAGLGHAPIRCEGHHMPDLVYLLGNMLVVNESKVNSSLGWGRFKHCYYQDIHRADNSDNNYKVSNRSKPFTGSIKLPLDAEFLRTECVDKSEKIISRSYQLLVPRKQELDELDYLNLKKRSSESSPEETLNVIMIGLDSLPRNQVLRALNKTYQYLLTSLHSFDFTMHSQLGTNTFENFLPLFSGHAFEEVKQWWGDQNVMDNLDLIWHTFEKAGYRTLYTEDWPSIGAFHYLKKGFSKPFATYNSRPLALAMEGDRELWRSNPLCAGNQLELSLHLDYLKKFMDAFPDKPVFGVVMISKVAHDYIEWTKKVDEHLLNFIKMLKDQNYLNKTLLINFSDHGTRFGRVRTSVNGIVEYRTPYTIFTFPDWFLQKYPDLVKNLEKNTKRLTSHFDTYATLLELIYFRSKFHPPVTPSRHGVSLFGKIPANRTCQDGPIPLELCLCGVSLSANLNSTNELTQSLAHRVLQELNRRRDQKLCAVLKIKKIIKILEFLADNVTIHYKVLLQTTPGDGIFEVSVFVAKNSTNMTVGDSIDRLNFYRGQADCVDSSEVRLFCFCKNLLPPLMLVQSNYTSPGSS